MPTHLKYIHFKQSNIHIATASRISRMLLLFFAVSLFLTRVESDYAPHLCPRLLSSTHLSPICCDPSPANHHRLLPSVESLPCWIVVLTCVSVDPAWLVSSLCFLVLLPNLFFLCRLPYPYLLLLPCGPWVGVSEREWTFLDWIWRFCDSWTVWRGVWRFPCPGHCPLRFPGATFPCCCIYFTWCASVNKPLSLFTSFESCT